MIDKTNDPAFRAYIEKERIRRRQNAAAGINQSIEAETPESAEEAHGGLYNTYKPTRPEVTMKVPKVKSTETPETNEINIFLIQELKNINNNLHLIQRELKNINKTLDRRKWEKSKKNF